MKNIKTHYLFGLFIIVAIAQLFVPMQMIFGQEKILNTGTAYKFITEPVDPSDPYRGKYITLRYAMDSAITTDSIWEKKQDVFVYLKTDSLGFAALKEVSKTALNIDDNYVIAQASWYNTNTNRLYFNLPFNRFYMNEDKAKPAEDAYRKAQFDTLPNNTYGLVLIKNGEAVLKDVLINDVPIADFVITK